MFSIAQNRHMASILNNPRLLHLEIIGALPYLILKFEACPKHDFSIYVFI